MLGDIVTPMILMVGEHTSVPERHETKTTSSSMSLMSSTIDELKRYRPASELAIRMEWVRKPTMFKRTSTSQRTSVLYQIH